MKRWLMFLFLLSFIFVSASVDIDVYDVRSKYVPFDTIDGTVNLTIDNEDYDEAVVLSNGSEIELSDFLTDNGVDFECFPSDCSMSYEASPGSMDESVSLLALEDKYIGFILEGENVVLDSMSFEVSSNFLEGIGQPLSIEFFEDWSWVFSEFSDEFLLKEWGCFDSVNKQLGPLVGNSFYCEMVDIGNSDVLRIGADVTGGVGELNMTFYPEGGFGASWKCSFDPNEDEGCIINPDMGEIFNKGKYQVCVGAEALTEYRIYQDELGENCGFAYNDGPGNSTKDYGVFAQGVKYADASFIDIPDFTGEKIDAANYIISERYDGNCSEGCILPLKVSGVAQNFRVSDVDLVYTDNSEWQSTNLVYELIPAPAKVDFNGTLDLELLGLEVVDEGEYFAKLSGEDLFRVDTELLPAPIISSVFPLDPPAGVPVTFYADIDFDENESLRYEWNFGNNYSANSTKPYVVYSYGELDNYTLTLRVSAGGNLTSEKSFDVDVISPELAIVDGLADRKGSLANVRSVVEKFPAWYGDAILGILEMARFEGELDRLSTEQNNSFDAEDFRDVAQKLYALDIPVAVGANNFESPFLMSEISDVKIEPVSIVSGTVSGATDAEYAKPILTWQNDNVDVVVKSKDVFASYLSGAEGSVLSMYSFEVTSRSDRESYFVINRPFGDLFFNGDSGARKAGDSTVIILDAGERKTFEFYYKDNVRGSFFVSPRLGSILLEGDIETDCNFNDICEEDMGENPDNCRSDCKPFVKAYFFLALLVLFFLFAYSGLQIWYKRHYENYLFKDRSQLYNMLMYVSNARARDVPDLRIRAELKAKGWVSERVNYVMKKSLGKSVGMIEIIPIERVSAWLRDRKAKQAVAKAQEVATRVQGENNGDHRVP